MRGRERWRFAWRFGWNRQNCVGDVAVPHSWPKRASTEGIGFPDAFKEFEIVIFCVQGALCISIRVKEIGICHRDVKRASFSRPDDDRCRQWWQWRKATKPIASNTCDSLDWVPCCGIRFVSTVSSHFRPHFKIVNSFNIICVNLKSCNKNVMLGLNLKHVSSLPITGRKCREE